MNCFCIAWVYEKKDVRKTKTFLLEKGKIVKKKYINWKIMHLYVLSLLGHWDCDTMNDMAVKQGQKCLSCA